MFKIIPAIDILNGKCVRLTKGDFVSEKVYNDDPLEVAKIFEDNGMRLIHLVDLDGAKSGRVVNWKILQRIRSATQLFIDFGGGVQSEADLNIAFESGADQLNIGSVAIKNKLLFLEWLKRYGNEKIILSADVREKKVSVSGWTADSDIKIDQLLLTYVPQGLSNLVCTDIGRDGTLLGPSVDLYKELHESFPDLNIIASGGVASISDIEILKTTGVSGVIVGKALYEKKIPIKDLIRYAY